MEKYVVTSFYFVCCDKNNHSYNNEQSAKYRSSTECIKGGDDENALGGNYFSDCFSVRLLPPPARLPPHHHTALRLPTENARIDLEPLTSWQYCKMPSLVPTQLLVPVGSGSHLPFCTLTCMLSFPQNMATWGSASSPVKPSVGTWKTGREGFY